MHAGKSHEPGKERAVVFPQGREAALFDSGQLFPLPLLVEDRKSEVLFACCDPLAKKHAPLEERLKVCVDAVDARAERREIVSGSFGGEQRVKERERGGRFHAGHGARHHAGVVAAGDGERRLRHRVEIDALLLLRDRGRWLEGGAQNERHAVADPAEDAAAAVRLGDDAAVHDPKSVVVLAAAQTRGAEAESELHALDGGDGEEQRGDAAFQSVKKRTAQTAREKLALYNSGWLWQMELQSIVNPSMNPGDIFLLLADSSGRVIAYTELGVPYFGSNKLRYYLEQLRSGTAINLSVQDNNSLVLKMHKLEQVQKRRKSQKAMMM